MCRELEKLLMEERGQERIETTFSALCSVMEEFSVSVDDAMRILKVPETDKETYRKLLDQ